MCHCIEEKAIATSVSCRLLISETSFNLAWLKVAGSNLSTGLLTFVPLSKGRLSLIIANVDGSCKDCNNLNSQMIILILLK